MHVPRAPLSGKSSLGRTRIFTELSEWSKNQVIADTGFVIVGGRQGQSPSQSQLATRRRSHGDIQRRVIDMMDEFIDDSRRLAIRGQSQIQLVRGPTTTAPCAQITLIDCLTRNHRRGHQTKAHGYQAISNQRFFLRILTDSAYHDALQRQS